MSLLFRLLRRARQKGIFFLETDTDSPYTSPDFLRYPRILADRRLTAFITDYLRLMLSGNMNALQLDTLMEQELETLEEEGEASCGGPGQAGGALPAFGIVAAVLGVIHTVSRRPPGGGNGGTYRPGDGGHIPGHSAVLRIYYPLAERLQMLQCVRMILIADLNGSPPWMSVEFGRKALYNDIRPSFAEIEALIVDIQGSVNTEA